jgi:hypothetical protein
MDLRKSDGVFTAPPAPPPPLPGLSAPPVLISLKVVGANESEDARWILVLGLGFFRFDLGLFEFVTGGESRVDRKLTGAVYFTPYLPYDAGRLIKFLSVATRPAPFFIL